MTNPAGFDLPTVRLVAGWAGAAALPRGLLFAVLWGESALNVDRVRTDGRAAGIVQMNIAVHGYDAAYWCSLAGAERSWAVMRSRWIGAWKQLGRPWASLTAHARADLIYAFWPAAQGCEQPSIERCREVLAVGERVDAAYAIVERGTPVVSEPMFEVSIAHPGNWGKGRIGALGKPIAPEAWVLHIAQGTFAGIDSWFKTGPADRNPPLPSAAHFSVAKDGRIRCHVLPEHTAFANGIIQDGYRAKLINENRYPDGSAINPNLWTISCEHEGDSGEAPTAAMFEASTRLCAWVFQTRLLTGGATGVAVDRDHIIRHGDISPADRSGCPGWSELQISTYISRVRALLQLDAPPPVEVDPRLRTLIDALTVSRNDFWRMRDEASMRGDHLDGIIKSFS